VVRETVYEKYFNHFNYLDGLREGGSVNMFGATPYLMRAFPELDEREAREVLGHWMRTFGERHPET